MFPDAPGAVAEPPVVGKKRAVWTQAEVATLVAGFDARTGAIGAMPVRFSRDEAVAKLIALGLVAKPEKASLTVGERESVELVLHDFTDWAEPARTLAIRHALKTLQGLLPKRVAK